MFGSLRSGIAVWTALGIACWASGAQAAFPSRAPSGICGPRFASLARARELGQRALRQRERALDFLDQLVVAQNPVRAIRANPSSSFVRKSLRTLGAMIGSVFKLLLPIPVPVPDALRGDVSRIFLKLWRDSSYAPSPSEVSVLARSNAWPAFQARKRFLRSHPAIHRSQRAAGLVGGGLLYLNAAAALRQAAEMADNTSGIDEYLDSSPEDAAGRPVVQVVVETTPFPHTAVRIGGRVYSYGQEEMTSKPFRAYFAPSPEPPPGAPLNQGGDWKSRALEAAMRELPRAVRVVDLHLRPEEIARLQRQLELNTGKRYHNVTGINDCATMIARALDENSSIHVSELLDPYPSVMASYLGMRAALGDDRIGPTRLVVFDSAKSKASYLARNAYIAMLEGRIALGSLPINYPYRKYLDLTLGPEELQGHGLEAKQRIEAWSGDERARMAAELSNYLPKPDYFSTVAALPPSPAKETAVANARGLIGIILDPKEREARAVLDAPNSELKDIVLAIAKQEAVARAREDWSTQLSR